MPAASTTQVLDTSFFVVTMVGFMLSLLPLARNIYHFDPTSPPGYTHWIITGLWLCAVAIMVAMVVQASLGKWDSDAVRQASTLVAWGLLSGAIGVTLYNLSPDSASTLHPTSLVVALLVCTTQTVFMWPR
jgi:hypothetical protein